MGHYTHQSPEVRFTEALAREHELSQVNKKFNYSRSWERTIGRRCLAPARAHEEASSLISVISRLTSFSSPVNTLEFHKAQQVSIERELAPRRLDAADWPESCRNQYIIGASVDQFCGLKPGPLHQSAISSQTRAGIQ
jgi:hypothetical protein